MIQSEFKGIKISGIATAVPKNREIIIDKYSNIFGTEAVEQFSKTTGVLERRIANDNQTSSDFAYVAANELLNKKQINREEIGIAIYITQTPDYLIPATACVLHKRLGLSKDCICFDVNLGCSGYVYGMQILSSLLSNTNCKYGLLMVGDTSSSRGISPEDKSAIMLFGDAGSATLFEKADKTCTIRNSYRSDGEGFKTIIRPAGSNRKPVAETERVVWGDGNKRSDYDLYMNGVDVFSFTVFEVPSLINEFIESFSVEKDDVDSFVFHQANCYIIKQVVKKSKLPKEKIPISMDRYANTSVTSIPLTLCDTYGNRNDDRVRKIFSCGFGVGLSWGISLFDINEKDILPIIETDDYFTEGDVSHD